MMLNHRLCVELLESRELLSGLIEPGEAFFWHDISGQAGVIECDFTAPSDEDGKPETETYTRVRVSLELGRFDEFATLEASWPIEGTRRVREFTVPASTNGHLAISLRSLGDILTESPDFLAEMTAYRLYATQVTIRALPKIDGRWQVDDDRVEHYYITRFISPLNQLLSEPVEKTPLSVPTNVIPFEMTTFDPDRPATNRKVLEMIAPSRHSPAMRFKGASYSSPLPFEDAGGTAGRHVIEYTPSAEASEDAAIIELLHEDQPYGSIILTGRAIQPRTWHANAEELASQLQSAFPQYAGDYSTLADDILCRVEDDFGGFWGRFSKRVDASTEAPNEVRVRFRNLSGRSGSTPMTLDRSVEFLVAVIERYRNRSENDLNTVAYSYAMGEALYELYSELNKQQSMRKDQKPLTSRIDVGEHAFAPSDTERFERSLAKTIAHELGHAHGFLGHVIPRVTEDGSSRSYFDLMQQGYGDKHKFRIGTEVGESQPYFMLMLGRNWEADNVKLALDGITTTGSCGELARCHHLFENIDIENHYPWHNPVNPADVNDDGHVSPIDALLIISELNTGGSRLLRAESPWPHTVPFVDVSRDGFVSPIDALVVISHLNSRGSGPVKEGSVAPEAGEGTWGPVPMPVIPNTEVAEDDAEEDDRLLQRFAPAPEAPVLPFTGTRPTSGSHADLTWDKDATTWKDHELEEVMAQIAGDINDRWRL